MVDLACEDFLSYRDTELSYRDSDYCDINLSYCLSNS